MKKIIVLILMSSPILTANKPVFLFSHGLADTGLQAKKYRSICPGTMYTFNYPDGEGILAKTMRVNFTQTDLAQEGEIERLLKSEQDVVRKTDANISIIGVGNSRGASVFISAAQNLSNVKALILISPFDSVMGVIKDKWPEPWKQNATKALISRGYPFFKHKLNGIRPIDMVDKVPKDMPVLIICSQEDTTVPASSSKRLAEKLKLVGHTKTHLVCLERGRHAQLLEGPDGKIAKMAVTWFLKKYALI